VVNSLTVYDGELIAGGEFTLAEDSTVNNIASWMEAIGQP
jgi:hypothetical protein